MNTQIGRPDLAHVFQATGKYNDLISLSREDQKARVKVLCQEDYAQSLYDMMTGNGHLETSSKDLILGEIYKVRATRISFSDSYIHAEELGSRTEIIIPFKEFSKPIEDLSKGEGIEFFTMIYRNDSGEFYGSEKKCMSVNYKTELLEHFESNSWFDVKLKKLIKGGYVATYKDSVDCFIPGSHAGANVIRDFSKLLGETRTVMVDNYDQTNDLFILSYKKYIKHSMSEKISDLQFGKKYTGTLTNRPYDFGIFVEFEDYYTGLIHSTEFTNYEDIKRQYRSGDEIEFYIKNVTRKGKEYRIVLTTDPESIDAEKKRWDDLRSRTENQIFDYDVDQERSSIKIKIDDLEYEVTLKRKDLEETSKSFPKVKVFKVDPINKSLKFEFVN